MLLALDLRYYNQLWQPWRELERTRFVASAAHGVPFLAADAPLVEGPLWTPGFTLQPGELRVKLD